MGQICQVCIFTKNSYTKALDYEDKIAKNHPNPKHYTQTPKWCKSSKCKEGKVLHRSPNFKKERKKYVEKHDIWVWEYGAVSTKETGRYL